MKQGTLENADRVRENTRQSINERLDREIRNRALYFATCDAYEITERIDELEREWDIERVLQANASALALSGLGLAVASKNKKWLFVPGIVLSFLMQHTLQGWCPPVPFFRRLGVRTRPEIEREKYVLKVLRGDFDKVSTNDGDNFDRAEDALAAVKE